MMRFFNLLVQKNFFFMFLFFFFLSVLNGYFLNWLNNILGIKFQGDDFPKMTPLLKASIIIIIAPFIETIVFQYVPIQITRKFITQKKWVVISLSALLFSIFHIYNITYFFMALIGGLLMGTFYHIAEYKKKSPILFTFLLHAFYNMYGYLFVN
jgi:uncharacterized protein